jgi:CBS domain-containing protein
VERQALPPASRDEIAAAYDFLMRLRLRGQAQAVHQGEPPDNRVLLRRLGYSEKALLRQAFVQIAAVQHRIRYEFLGGT